MMTFREIILKTARHFQDAGIPDAVNDASLLMSRLTGRPPLDLRLDFETVPDPSVLSMYSTMVEKRMARVPLQYILGEAPFFSRLFSINENVLIPRPETELLCEWILETITCIRSPRILDLCCGSGCIGLTLKAERPDADVMLSDLSAKALEVAANNAVKLSVDVSFHQGDLFAGLPSAAVNFDLIVSNPPYIPSAECATLQPEVLHEPRLALDGGADGLDLYRRIVHDAGSFLVPGGRLFMECGSGEAGSIASLLNANGFASVTIRKDYSRIDRMILATIP